MKAAAVSLLAIKPRFNRGDGRYFRAQPLGKREPRSHGLASWFRAFGGDQDASVHRFLQEKPDGTGAAALTGMRHTMIFIGA